MSPVPDLGRRTIQEVARRSGFSEATLRYYERVGLIDPVPRDPSSGHRRYPASLVDQIEALGCLRATGMGIEDLRSYLSGIAAGPAAAPQMAELFARHLDRLDAEMAALQLRRAYIAAKTELWQSRVDGDRDREGRAEDEARSLADKLDPRQ
jgi:MerR family transcriptional regulator, aldehyde-responsive regulator